MNPAIVVIAHDRPISLKRLLSSLDRTGISHEQVNLVISIDGPPSHEVVEIAERFVWKNGDKRIIKSAVNMGLRDHILSCGDLSEEYGAVILLEDDLVVSPMLHQHACQALSWYEECDSVGGIALYSPRFNEVNQLPFEPLYIGDDWFFMQLPCSWGQAWTAKKWGHFRSWLEDGSSLKKIIDELPNRLKQWPQSSWKKMFAAYLIDQGRYFAYPYVSYTTNCGDRGVNNRIHSNLFQVSVAAGRRASSALPTFSKSSVTYDVWGEPLPEMLESFFNLKIPAEGVLIDLHGQKAYEDRIKSWAISPFVENPICSFPLMLKPIENNLAVSSKSAGFFRLGKVKRKPKKFSYFLVRVQLFFHYVGYKRSQMAVSFAVTCVWKDLLKIWSRIFK